MGGVGFSLLARGVGLAFFGRLVVGPKRGVWFVVDGVVVGACPSFLGGRLSFSLRFSLALVGHVLLALGICCLLFRAVAPFLVLGEVLTVFLVSWGLGAPCFVIGVVGLLPFWK